jgi:lipopolysaccharide transport protein LptA
MRGPKIILILLLASSLLTTYATTADNNKPIVITSNTLTGNLNQQMAVFSGNVVAIQGTRQLESNEAYTYFAAGGKVNLIKAVGNPAKTTEMLDAKGNHIYGQALIIEYFPPKSFIQYEQEARLEENGNIFTGDLITYNIVNQIVASPRARNNTGPATIILPPAGPTKKS